MEWERRPTEAEAEASNSTLSARRNGSLSRFRAQRLGAEPELTASARVAPPAGQETIGRDVEAVRERGARFIGGDLHGAVLVDADLPVDADLRRGRPTRGSRSPESRPSHGPIHVGLWPRSTVGR